MNSAVVIAAENPRLRTRPAKAGSDYFGPLTDLTKSKGFNRCQRALTSSLVGTMQLVRADFSKHSRQSDHAPELSGHA